jgi:anaerobic selenocysteine-containing dehydrogenase
MKIRRRDFLKLSAAAGAAATVGKPALHAFAETASEKAMIGEKPGKWMASTCQGCTTWCPIEIFVQDGRATKVRGNQLSKANNGYCCVRGHMIVQQIYDPDRIKTPMKRTNPEKGRGVDPKFVPITWDEAMDTIADKIMELRKNNETHKYLLMRGRYSYNNDLLYSNLTKVIGSPNNISHSAICAEVEKMGSFYTEGFWGYRDYDLDNMKYLIVWGCDPLSSNRQIPNAVNKFGNLLDQGTVVAIDPRMTSAATKAHKWLPIKPGEDGALAAAMAHVILTSGLWNKGFCGDFKDGKNLFKAGQTVDEEAFDEKLTHGLVKWWNIELKDRTAEWAAAITGIHAGDIIEVATGFAKAAPSCAVWYGPNMQPRGTYSAMAMHALNGLVGGTDSVGGVCTGMSSPSSGHLKVDDFLDEIAKEGSKNKKIDQRGTLEFPALSSGKVGGGVVTNNVANAVLAGNPYDIKVAIGYFNNFNFSGTNGARWDKALAKIPFFAHITTMASEMSQFADIVLPSAMHHSEQWAPVKSKANLHGHTSLQQPLIKRMFEVKAPETEFVWLLAEKLKARGFANPMDWLLSYKDPETGKPAANAEEFALVATKVFTQKAWDPAENKDYKGDRPSGWADFAEKGIVNSEKFTFGKKWETGFEKTVTQKFEFYSETLKKVLTEHADKQNVTIDKAMEAANYTARGEQAFVPHYEPVFRHGDVKDFPFTLVDMKSRLNREGRSGNLPWYMTFKQCDPGEVNNEDVLQINPADAEKLGVKEGDMVKVTSTVGSLTVRARLWEGILPGTVAKCYGQGHWAYGRVAAKDYARAIPNGANFNEIMPDEYDRLVGASCRNGGFTGLKIEKA